METTILKYTVIKDRPQYEHYCKLLEALLSGGQAAAVQDEIDLLTLLIETYDEQHSTFQESDPITLLRSFMKEHHLKPQNLVEILGVSKGYVSEVLNYKKALSKEAIRKLAGYFKVKQEAFNRRYELKVGNFRHENIPNIDESKEPNPQNRI